MTTNLLPIPGPTAPGWEVDSDLMTILMHSNEDDAPGGGATPGSLLVERMVLTLRPGTMSRTSPHRRMTRTRGTLGATGRELSAVPTSPSEDLSPGPGGSPDGTGKIEPTMVGNPKGPLRRRARNLLHRRRRRLPDGHV